MEQMAKYYCWGMSLSARTAGAAAATTTSLIRSWPPPALGHSSGGEPSWEELAFARDAAGHLGGCVWPPRSYTCTFCRREFRSAQALGGHMNVHRRDRARLRHCASPDLDDDDKQQPSSIAPLPAEDPQPQDHESNSSLLFRANKPLLISAAACDDRQTSIINKEAVISIPAAAVVTPRVMIMSKEIVDYDEEEAIVAEERRKRRRIHQQQQPLYFLRPPQLLASSKGVEEHDDDAIKQVPNDITSPSSPNPPLLHLAAAAGRQEVDLELRLGSI